MKNKIDSILLGLLWLLAGTLGLCFWFNTIFGFNIFAAQHWSYLAYLQAAGTPIRSTFYISFVIGVCIIIGGLYILVRPRLRRIRLPRLQRATAPRVIPESSITVKTPVDSAVASQDTKPRKALVRPHSPIRPRLAGTTTPVAQSQNLVHAPASAPLATPTPSQHNPEITEIFESAGYVVKKKDQIQGTPITVFALGTSESLWIGSIGIPTTKMRQLVDRLAKVFSDTLDDIEITINAFVIGAPDASTSEFEDILMFPDTEDLREYMAQHPNIPPQGNDEQENFNAYSEYIDTVLRYIGR